MLEATTLDRQSTTSKLADHQSATTPMETVKSNVLADVIQD